MALGGYGEPYDFHSHHGAGREALHGPAVMDVDEQFALDEGENEGSLTMYRRQEHARYYGRQREGEKLLTLRYRSVIEPDSHLTAAAHLLSLV